MSATISEDRNREDRLRRKATANGLQLRKNTRTWIRENFGDQYHLVDGRNIVVCGAATREFDATLDDVESYLASVA
jgi:hypothetical protein